MGAEGSKSERTVTKLGLAESISTLQVMAILNIESATKLQKDKWIKTVGELLSTLKDCVIDYETIKSVFLITAKTLRCGTDKLVNLAKSSSRLWTFSEISLDIASELDSEETKDVSSIMEIWNLILNCTDVTYTSNDIFTIASKLAIERAGLATPEELSKENKRTNPPSPLLSDLSLLLYQDLFGQGNARWRNQQMTFEECLRNITTLSIETLLHMMTQNAITNIVQVELPNASDADHAKLLLLICHACRNGVEIPIPEWLYQSKEKFMDSDAIRTMRIKMACSSKVNGKLVIPYGPSVIPDLDPSNSIHEQIMRILDDQVHDIVDVGPLCCIDLFRIYSMNCTLDIDTYISIMKKCHDVLCNAQTDEAEKEPGHHMLIMAGVATAYNTVAMPTSFESLLFEPDEDPCHIAATAALLAAQLVPTPEVSDCFLDFMIHSTTAPVFMKLFGEKVEPEMLNEISKARIATVLQDGHTKTLLQYAGRNDAVFDILLEFSREKNDKDLFIELVKRQPGKIAEDIHNDSAIMTIMAEYCRSLVFTETVETAYLNNIVASSPVLSAIIYKNIAELALVTPTKARKILGEMHIMKNCASTIMNSIPVGTKMTSELVDFIIFVLSFTKRYQYQKISDCSHIQPLECAWSEDSPAHECDSTCQDEETTQHKCTRIVTGKEYISQPVFRCYTCGLTGNLGCCSVCAETCHKGHDLIYTGVGGGFFCDCVDSPGRCQFENEIESRPTEQALQRKTTTISAKTKPLIKSFSSTFGKQQSELKKEEQDPISLTSAFTVMSALGSHEEDAVATIQNRTTRELRDIDLQKLGCLQTQHFHYERVDAKLFNNLHSIVSGRNASDGIHITAVVGENKDMLVVCDGSSMKTYRLSDHSLLNTTGVSKADKLLAYDPNPAIFAASSTDRVYIYNIGENGVIRVVHELRIPSDPSRQGSGWGFRARSQNTGTYIQWVPGKDMHIAVTTQNHVRVYDVANKAKDPYVTFESERILSSVICEHQGNYYAFLGYMNGNFVTMVEFSQPNKHIRVPVNTPASLCMISCCQEEELLFISTGNSQRILIARISDVIETRNLSKSHCIVTQKNDDVALTLRFLFRHPQNRNMFIMRGKCMGSLFVVEIGDEGSVCCEVQETWKRVTINDGNLYLYAVGAYVNGENVECVAYNGDVYVMTPGMHIQERYVICDSIWPPVKEQKITDGYKFIVPSSFWVSRVKCDNSIATITDHQGANLDKLLHGSSNTWMTNKVTLILVPQADRVIAAVKISVSGQGFIQIFDRKYQTGVNGDSRCYDIPLRDSEIVPGRVIPIRIESTSGNVQVGGMSIYTEEGKSVDSIQWYDNTDLSCFEDSYSITVKRDEEHLMALIATAPLCSDDEASGCVKELLKIMYSTPELASVCRKMVLVSMGDTERLSRIWCDAIKESCEEKLVHQDMVKLLWRDFVALPAEVRSEVSEVVWSLNTTSSWHSLVSAFL